MKTMMLHHYIQMFCDKKSQWFIYAMILIWSLWAPGLKLFLKAGVLKWLSVFLCLTLSIVWLVLIGPGFPLVWHQALVIGWRCMTTDAETPHFHHCMRKQSIRPFSNNICPECAELESRQKVTTSKGEFIFIVKCGN